MKIKDSLKSRIVSAFIAQKSKTNDLLSDSELAEVLISAAGAVDMVVSIKEADKFIKSFLREEQEEQYRIERQRDAIKEKIYTVLISIGICISIMIGLFLIYFLIMWLDNYWPEEKIRTFKSKYELHKSIEGDFYYTDIITVRGNKVKLTPDKAHNFCRKITDDWSNVLNGNQVEILMDFDKKMTFQYEMIKYWYGSQWRYFVFDPNIKTKSVDWFEDEFTAMSMTYKKNIRLITEKQKHNFRCTVEAGYIEKTK